MVRPLSLLSLLLLLTGCGVTPQTTPPPVDLLEPASGALTGYYRVLIELTDEGLTPNEVLGVRVGGVSALDLVTTPDNRLSILVQGAPEPGAANIDLVTADESIRLPQPFTYSPPVDPSFQRVVAFGASLTQGVQDGTPTHQGVMGSPALALARAMGAWMPQPVLVEGLFPTLGLDTVGPAPDCDSANVPDFIRGALTDVLSRLADPDEGFVYWVGRSDPDISVRNLAAGNFMVDDMLLGPEVDEIVQNFLGPLSIDPYADFAGGSRWTMLEAVERLDPTVIVSFDLMGNDVLNKTPIEVMRANIPLIVDRLAATGAQVFLADMPDPGILKGSLGDQPLGDEEQDLADLCNEALRDAVAPYDNVHVVPLSERAEELATDGVVAGGQALTIDMLGGILSFDGLHFSDSGYALIADLFIDEINATLGTSIPNLNLELVVGGDIHSPSAVREAGRDPLACQTNQLP